MRVPITPDRTMKNVFWSADLPAEPEAAPIDMRLAVMLSAERQLVDHATALLGYTSLAGDYSLQLHNRLEALATAYDESAASGEQDNVGALLRQSDEPEEGASFFLFRLHERQGDEENTTLALLDAKKELVGKLRVGLGLRVGTLVGFHSHRGPEASQTSEPRFLPLHETLLDQGQPIRRRSLFAAVAIGQVAAGELSAYVGFDYQPMQMVLQAIEKATP